MIIHVFLTALLFVVIVMLFVVNTSELHLLSVSLQYDGTYGRCPKLFRTLLMSMACTVYGRVEKCFVALSSNEQTTG